MLALQTLVHGARHLGEPGLFVSFEESASRLQANAAPFGWDLPSLEGRLEFLDVRPPLDVAISGQFDLGGLLASLEAKARQLGARRIAIDALDVLLALVPDPEVVRREVLRLHAWLDAQGLTALLTLKDGGPTVIPMDFVQYLVDCAVVLEHRTLDGISYRGLQILKYRGSGFEENRTPFVIGSRGIDVADSSTREGGGEPATGERVSSGVPRLDTMLCGGYFRGSSTLITGAPGTAKTTLCGAFAQAACERGERTLFFTYDSRSDEILRNMASVGLDLSRFVASGLLRLVTTHAFTENSELHLMRIRDEAHAHRATALVIDPVSALARSGLDRMSVERLVVGARADGVTLLCTSLLERAAPDAEASAVEISTLADTWIHLTYHVAAGERNRGLTIVKSRGTGHSNQVRELMLSDDGVTLSDVYIAGGEVLMGTLRQERERRGRLAEQTARAEEEHRRLVAEGEMAELEARLAGLQRELELRRAQQAVLATAAGQAAEDSESARRDLLRLRRADELP